MVLVPPAPEGPRKLAAAVTRQCVTGRGRSASLPPRNHNILSDPHPIPSSQLARREHTCISFVFQDPDRVLDLTGTLDHCSAQSRPGTGWERGVGEASLEPPSFWNPGDTFTGKHRLLFYCPFVSALGRQRLAFGILV